MKLTLLTDNHTYIDRYFLGEPAFSCWIEAEGRRFLLDTGYSDVFLRNAGQLGLPVEALDAVILSHGHNDHTGGLEPLCAALGERRPELIAHPGVFEPRYDGGAAVGCPVPREKLERHFALHLTREPLWLTERLVFLGEVPELAEPRQAVGTLADGSPDRCLDDSALAWAGRKGAYLITGCSHSGLRNLMAYALEVTGCEKIAGILGGFHLLKLDALARRTVADLARRQVEELWPCHCTAFSVRAELARYLNVNEAGVSLTLNWE